MIKILASSPDLKFIENSINKYFYSKYYYIDDNLVIKSKFLDKNVDYHFRVRKIKNRYQFIYDSSDKV